MLGQLHLARRTALGAVTGTVALAVGLAVVVPSAGADEWGPGPHWAAYGAPYGQLGMEDEIHWTSADAGPYGTAIVQTVATTDWSGDPTSILRTYVQPVDGSERAAQEQIGERVETAIVAADEETGEIAVLYWELSGSPSGVAGTIPGVMTLVTSTSGGTSWSAPLALETSEGSSPHAILLPGLAVGGGRVHVAVTTQDGLHVHSGAVSAGELTRHQLDTSDAGLDTVYGAHHLDWWARVRTDTVAPRLDAAPDGSAHVLWARYADEDGTIGNVVASSTDTTWAAHEDFVPPVLEGSGGGPAAELLHGGDRLLVVGGHPDTLEGNIVRELTAAGLSDPKVATGIHGLARTAEPTVRAKSLMTTGILVADADAPAGVTEVPWPGDVALSPDLFSGVVGGSVWLGIGWCGTANEPCAMRWDETTASWIDRGHVQWVQGMEMAFIADTGSLGGTAVLGRVGTRMSRDSSEPEWHLLLQLTRRVVPGSTVTATTTVTQTASPTATPTVTVTATTTATPTVTNVVTVTATPPPPAPPVLPPVTTPVEPRPVGDLRARTKRNGDVVVRWDRGSASGTQAVSGYTVRVGGKVRAIDGRTTTRWVHKAAKDGKRYRYVVRATNDAGSSKPRSVRHTA
jgi:hypothetical protein